MNRRQRVEERGRARSPGLGGAELRQAALRLDRAVDALRRRHPELSAGTALWSWQKAAFAGAVLAIAAGALTAPRETLAALMAFLALPFFCVVVLRAIALGQAGGAPRSAGHKP